MCIIFWSASSTYSLILAANRDEFLARPTTPAAFHSFAPPSEASPHSSQPSPAQPFLAGLDLSAGGTWLGLSTKGGLSRLRFSTLTNYTETIASTDPPRPSRGNLVRHFLDEDDAASLEQYLERVEQDKAAYAGFNLLVGELGDAGQWRMGYVSNREDKGGRVVEGGEELDGPSVKGLSNATLDVDWPKVVSGCRAVKEVVQSTALGNEVELLQGLWDALSAASPFPIAHRMHLRHTVLVRPTFLDPLAPLPDDAPPLPEASSAASPAPNDLTTMAERVEGKGGHWYATRVQTVVLVEKQRDERGRSRVLVVERDAYVLDAGGRPKWSGKERRFEFWV